MSDWEVWPGEDFEPLFTGPEWVRFDRYEVVREPRSQLLYVVPARDAKMERYRPFDRYWREGKDILLDFLSLGQQREEDEARRARAICRFAARYGLLGLFWKNLFTLEKRQRRYDGRSFYVALTRGTVFAHAHGFKNLELYEEYARAYFPRLEKPPYPNPATAPEEFWREYGEPASHFVIVARHLARHAESVAKFEAERPYPGAFEFRVPPADLEDVKLDLRYDDRGWHLFLGFRCLLDAIWVMHLLNVVERRGKARLCAECGRPFLARKGHQAFCSQACGSVNRQRRRRTRCCTTTTLQQPDPEWPGKTGMEAAGAEPGEPTTTEV